VSPHVEVTGLAFGYNGRPVSDGLTFRADPGRITLLMGANGSGKTTLLKTIAGLLPPIAGRVRPSLSMGKGGVVFVHSTPFLFAGTVGKNLRVVTTDEGLARQSLARLDVESLWEHDVRTLSSGQRQRVAIARALAVGPRLLLVDEPEGGLDRQAVESWRRVLEEAIAQRTFTVVIASHDATATEGLPVDHIRLEPRRREGGM
jgi:ABC-type Mn2+/Zn2+ transport system ATPase subunit